MQNEIPLTGGRVTEGVVRIGNTVRRPLCEASPLAHKAMNILSEKGLTVAPKFLGIDDKGREITEFIEGFCPPNLDLFESNQLIQATNIIKQLHRALQTENGMVICHGDLSPCNFIFIDNMPACVIDWDAAHIGNPITDLAYALWLWLDIGYEELPIDQTINKIRLMSKTYGLSEKDYTSLPKFIISEMERVGMSIFTNKKQQSSTRSWAMNCCNFFKQNFIPIWNLPS